MTIVKRSKLKIASFSDVKNRCMLYGHVFVLDIFYSLLSLSLLLALAINYL